MMDNTGQHTSDLRIIYEQEREEKQEEQRGHINTKILKLEYPAPVHPKLHMHEQAAPFVTKSLLSHWPLPLETK